MDKEHNQSATNLEFMFERILEKLGKPKRVGQPSGSGRIHPPFDHRVDPYDLRLPGIVSEPEWSVAEQLTEKTETAIFSGKLSPLNHALLFRTIYVELLQMQLKPN